MRNTNLWLFSWDSNLKLAGHSGHMCRRPSLDCPLPFPLPLTLRSWLSPPWWISMWRLSDVGWKKRFSQRGQLNMRDPPWVRLWRSRLAGDGKLFLQILQLKSFSPVCWNTCSRRRLRRVKPCPQCGHSWGRAVRDQSRLSLAGASMASEPAAAVAADRNTLLTGSLNKGDCPCYVKLIWYIPGLNVMNVLKCWLSNEPYHNLFRQQKRVIFSRYCVHKKADTTSIYT